MNDNNQTIRKCRICGKTIVGINKIGICTRCKKSVRDKGLVVLGILPLIAGGVWTRIKALKKDNKL